MKILFIHNRYQQPGGEDQVFAAESSMMEQNGDQVNRLVVDNDSINNLPAILKTALATKFSSFGENLIKRGIAEFKPDVVHAHNFFPRLSPSVFYACAEAHVPVVHTLHNFRIICPSSTLMVNGLIYEKSLKHSAYWSVFKRAYRGSFLGTIVLARMIEYHKQHRTWQNKVDAFIVLTQFARDKFIEAGLPADKIFIKPNFINGPPLRRVLIKRHGALFVGRLSEEKGLGTLIKAWEKINYPLLIAGDGPLRNLAKQSPANVKFLGSQSRDRLFQLMQKSSFLVIPSECYEGLPMVMLEAYSQGLPVLGSRLGGLEELITDGVCGLHFMAKSPDDLRQKADWLVNHPQECAKMGRNAEQLYQDKYTQSQNYQLLSGIYQKVIKANK